MVSGPRFIRDGADDVKGGWEVQLAKFYYSRLFKEYAIADLSRYKVGVLTSGCTP
jgi:Folate-sensitive fragile site protein Fra10Ac1